MHKYYLILGLVSFIVGILPILESFDRLPFSFPIPAVVYYYLLTVAGLFLIFFGLRSSGKAP